MKAKENLFWGYALLGIGGMMLLGNFFSITLELLWPLFPLMAGIAMIYGFIGNRKNYGVLMPGAILILTSLLFFYCIIAGWENMAHLWPVFILAPGIGFAAMYYWGPREGGLLIPAGILIGLSAVFLFFSSGLWRLWPVVLIVVGLYLIFTYNKDSSDSNTTASDDDE